MNKKVSFKINYLISLFILILSSSSLLGTVCVDSTTFRSELPRSLNANKIKLKFTLKNIEKSVLGNSEDVEKAAALVKIYLPSVDANLDVPETESPSIDFTKSLSPNDSQVEEDSTNVNYYNATLSFEIKESKEGALNAAIQTAKKLDFAIEFNGETKQTTGCDGTTPLTAKILAPVKEAPVLVEVVSGFRSVRASWEAPEKVTLADGSESAPLDLSLIVIKKDKESVEIPAKQYSEAEDTDTTCTINLNVESGTVCDSCTTQNTYFDLSTLPEGVSVVNVDDINKKSTTLGGLEVSQEYLVLAQYGSSGLSRSNCFIAAPYTNYSMSEFFEGTTAKQDDLSCFIATAAYGTSFSKELYILRWFRDTYLKSNTLGSKFVELYYRYSPPVARFISNHPSLATLTRAILFVPVKISYLLLLMSPFVPAWISLLMVMIVLVLVGFGFSKLIRFSRR